MEETKFIDKAKKYFSNNTMDAVSTLSAFLSAMALYTIVSGITEDFSWDSLISWKSLAVSFLGGIGVMFVQEDGMFKARLAFLNREDVKDYDKDNKEIQDKIIDFEFKSQFIRNKNKTNIRELKEDYRIKREHELGIELENAKQEGKPYEHLEKELKRIKDGEIKDNEIEYTPYEISDIFSLGDINTKLGKEEFQDKSDEKQRKSNIAARIYSPIIMVLITGVLSSITKNVWILVWSAFSFLLLLLLQWYLAHKKTTFLKEVETLPIKQKKNNMLKEAEKLYKEWLENNTIKEESYKIKIEPKEDKEKDTE